jgi:putative tryptophan/tyrosine transport system substrate-binding protein
MRRRKLLVGLGGAAMTWSISARAQQPKQMRLVGVLQDLAESDSVGQSEVAAFYGAFAKLGWTEGRTFRSEVRWAAGNADRMKALAKELVDLQPDAILARGTPVTRALAGETRTIPIVFVVVADPIGSGFAASLARPGGNITGFANNFAPLAAKWVQLLKEIAPRIDSVALLFNPATLASLQLFLPSIQTTASALAIEVSVNPVHASHEIEGVIAAQARSPGGGLIVMPDGFNLVNRQLIISLAARYRVPTIYFNGAFYAELGGLITYGPDFIEYYRQAAGYIDRILKGEKPEDLPIQQPTIFQLVINLKTARGLGLEVPPMLLARADKVIE